MIVKNKNGKLVHEEIKTPCVRCGIIRKIRHACTDYYKIGEDGIAYVAEECKNGYQMPELCPHCDEELLAEESTRMDKMLANASDWLITPTEPEIEPIKEEYVTVKNAPDSSFKQIKETLDAGKRCSAVIVEYDIFVHHCGHHDELQHSIGSLWSQNRGDGHFYFVELHGKKSFVASWKSDTHSKWAEVGRRCLEIIFGR